LCRFFDREVRDNMQRVAVGAAPAVEEPAAQGAVPLLDLRALLRGRFGA